MSQPETAFAISLGPHATHDADQLDGPHPHLVADRIETYTAMIICRRSVSSPEEWRCLIKALTPRTEGQAGLSRSALYRGARAGQLDRIARGIYLPSHASAADWDQIEAATRRPDATICLTSALSRHDLIDAIPATLDVAIPRGARTPASTGAITWHQFDRATFEIGREQIAITGSDQTIGIYSPERSIADAFRLRGELGYELARDALREWLRRGGKPAQLIDTASRLPRTKSTVLLALEVLG